MLTLLVDNSMKKILIGLLQATIVAINSCFDLKSLVQGCLRKYFFLKRLMILVVTFKTRDLA